MHTIKLLTFALENHHTLAYVLIFLGLVFEGEVTLIATGVLVYLGILNFWFSLAFILVGGICKTFIGYYLGKILHKKWNHTRFLKYIEKKVSYAMPRFDQRPFWSIFFSKFIMGVNHIVIIFSGYKKVPLNTYLKAEIISTFIWAPVLLSLGFFFGYTAINITKEIGQFLLIVILLFLAFVLFDKLVGVFYEIFEETDYENK
ncbi:MAG: VTT domain-containing protein [Candidatus Nomurabacteria bacterium]|nr:VTT domain-containing protein [Candidatus Nomurabacteria bacterium]